MSETNHRILCRRCRRPLASEFIEHDGTRKQRWIHTLHRLDESIGCPNPPDPVVDDGTFPGSAINLCDFCSEPAPTWIYPCSDVMTPIETLGSVGAWAACDTCAEMIEGRRVHQLANRAYAAVEDTLPPNAMMRRVYQVQLQDLHRSFLKARIGERVPSRGYHSI